MGFRISGIPAQPGGKIRSFSWQTEPFGLNLGEEARLSLAVFNFSKLQSNYEALSHLSFALPLLPGGPGAAAQRANECVLWAPPAPGPRQLSPRVLGGAGGWIWVLPLGSCCRPTTVTFRKAPSPDPTNQCNSASQGGKRKQISFKALKNLEQTTNQPVRK